MRIYLTDITGKEYVSDATDMSDEELVKEFNASNTLTSDHAETVEDVAAIMEQAMKNFGDMTNYTLMVDGYKIIFNPRNIVSFYIKP